jgi:hypothetical protein
MVFFSSNTEVADTKLRLDAFWVDDGKLRDSGPVLILPKRQRGRNAALDRDIEDILAVLC